MREKDRGKHKGFGPCDILSEALRLSSGLDPDLLWVSPSWINPPARSFRQFSFHQRELPQKMLFTIMFP